MRRFLALTTLVLALALTACGGSEDTARRDGPPSGRGGGPSTASDAGTSAVPVQVELVQRRAIAQHLETNGVLEAENEVDLIARISGPITELLVEEGDLVERGRLLARIDDREPRNQVAIATVARDEAKLSLERTETSWSEGLVAREVYDTALSTLQSTEAQLESAEIQLGYTEVRAPFTGLVVTRYIKRAEHLTSGAPLFRLSDFTPLLCPIEVPEKELGSLRVGQWAMLEVEAFSGDRFEAKVDRISPTVDPATGTLTVTLEVEGEGRLRPGMFASVFLEVDRHEGALVAPRQALVLDSIGDTVFVRDGGVASRREVRLGFREAELVEVLEGLSDGEEVIVLGQEGLADGTPVAVLGEPPAPAEVAAGQQGQRPPQMLEHIRQASPEDLERMKTRMRERGMSDEQIEGLIRQARGSAE